MRKKRGTWGLPIHSTQSRGFISAHSNPGTLLLVYDGVRKPAHRVQEESTSEENGRFR